MSVLNSLNAIMPLCMLIALGYFLKYRGFLNENFVSTGNTLCFKILFPAAMFNTLHSCDILQEVEGRSVALCVAGILLIFLVSFLVIPRIEKDNRRRGVLIQAMFHSNFIVYGTAVCVKMFGSNCEPLVAVLSGITIPVYNLLSAFTLEYFSTERKREYGLRRKLFEMFKNPLLCGIGAGLAWSFTGFKLPIVLENALGDLSKMATPLALLLLGCEFEFGHLKHYMSYIVWGNIVKQVILGSVLTATGVLIGLRGYELGAVMCIFCAPVAVCTNALAVKLGGDGELASVMIVSTTVVSAFVIFIMTYVLTVLNYL